MSAKCQKTYTPFVVFRNYRLKKSKKPIISFAISELIRIFALLNACTRAHDAYETTIYKICQ